MGLKLGLKLCFKLRLILGFGSTLGWMYEEKNIIEYILTFSENTQ